MNAFLVRTMLFALLWGSGVAGCARPVAARKPLHPMRTLSDSLRICAQTREEHRVELGLEPNVQTSAVQPSAVAISHSLACLAAGAAVLGLGRYLRRGKIFQANCQAEELFQSLRQRF